MTAGGCDGGPAAGAWGRPASPEPGGKGVVTCGALFASLREPFNILVGSETIRPTNDPDKVRHPAYPLA